MHELISSGWFLRLFSLLWLGNVLSLAVRASRGRRRGDRTASVMGQVVTPGPRPVVRFVPPDGAAHQFAMAAPAELAAGTTVTVTYNPDDHYDAAVAGASTADAQWLVPLVLGLFLLVGVGMAWASWGPLLGLPAPDVAQLVRGWAFGWLLIGFFLLVGAIGFVATLSAARSGSMPWWAIVVPSVILGLVVLAAVGYGMVQYAASR